VNHDVPLRATASQARHAPRRFAYSPKAVPFSVHVHSIFGTKIGEQQTSILSHQKILHHEFLLEKHLKIRGDKEHKNQRGITAA